MDWWSPKLEAMKLVVAVCALTMTGCSCLKMPQIDPTGERIFSEPLCLASTSPYAESRDPYTQSSPPYTDPQGPYRQPTAGYDSKAVELLLTPRVLVAPVGSEVILLAAVRGADSYLRTNQRVEWTIDGESVGHFVDVGQKTIMDWAVWDANWARKIDATHAITSTSRRYQRLTRGTGSLDDDVSVLEGQAWVSITSPQEGTSRISAFSPCITDWNSRLRISTIHWIDVQWSFPPPAINPAGTRHIFTTNVMRQSDQSPLIDWLVRYEIVDGPPAGFTPDGAQVVEVLTGSAGQASAEIFQKDPTPGTNRIDIQIIRPARAGGTKRLVVGNGSTLKTWSSPDLSMRSTGPSVAPVGSTVSYRIEISNPGDMPTGDLIVTETIPPEMSYLISRPVGQVSGRQVRWELPGLAGSETRVLQIDLRADRAAEVTHCVEATTSSGLNARDCTTTSVSTASVDVEIKGTDRAMVGQIVEFQITVTNRGQVTATGVMVKDRFDHGLEPILNPSEPPKIPKSIDWDLGRPLAPGETRRQGVRFRVTQAGQLCHTADVISEGIVLNTARACLTTTEPLTREPGPDLGHGTSTELPARISAGVTGPTFGTVGEKVEFVITVNNDDLRDVENLRVTSSFDNTLVPKRVDPVNQRTDAEGLHWIIPQLAARTSATITIECECFTVAPRACHRVQVSSTQSTLASDEICLEIRPKPVIRPAELTLNVSPLRDPVDVGEEVTYLVQVANRGFADDSRVVLNVSIPTEMVLDRLKTIGPEGKKYTVQAQTVRFDEIPWIVPDQKLEYLVRLRAKKAGAVDVIFALTSQTLAMPKTKEVHTTINP